MPDARETSFENVKCKIVEVFRFGERLFYGKENQKSNGILPKSKDVGQPQNAMENRSWILHSALCILHSKKQYLCCERRPYTHPSGVTPPRSFSSLLRTGNLAAHAAHRLMLLDPSPDMVHGSALRKTRSSTQENKLNSEEIDSQEWNPPLL